MNKQFLVVVAVVIAALVGIFVASSDKNGDSGNGSQATQPTTHTAGAGTEKVTLIEYGDFECSACGQFYPLIKQVKEIYGDRITFQFRHFPLTQVHPNAFAAHRAAEAAGNQGKFFEMHDLLYENQQSWKSSSNPPAVFEGYAQQLGLDVAKLKTDVASKATADIINADVKEGQALGANSTPTFVLNGKKIENPRDLESFKKLIDDAIAQAKNQ